MDYIQLNKDNCLYQIAKYGFFAESIPKCFDSSKFADYILSMHSNGLDNAKKIKTIPEELSTYKNNISRRIISVPNPEAFAELLFFIGEHWCRIEELTESPN